MKRHSNTEEFIESSISIHSDEFDYSDAVYIDSKTKVTIICREHGEFQQIPANHLYGQGCPKCRVKNRSLTQEQFIDRCKAIHEDKYDYSVAVYINDHTKVTIICPEHGEFQQIPSSHLSGHGCPVCKASKGELALKTIFKKHNIKYEPQYNIPEIVANYEIDFYLPDYRLLIEFHGKQHYEYISFFHDGDYTFEDQKTRDDIVRDAARRWKYRYLEFNYKQLKHMTKEQFEELVINKIK